MKTSRFMMAIAAACFIASSLAEAQGRGHAPAGRVPQTAKTGSSGPNVGTGRTGGGHAGNAPVTPGESGGRPRNPGAAPDNSGSRGGKAGNVGGGTAGEGRGNGGHPNNVGEGGNGGRPDNPGKGNGNAGRPDNPGEDRGNAGDRGGDHASGRHGKSGQPPANASNGRGNAGERDDSDNDQDAPAGGRRPGGSDKEHRASFVAKMNAQQRARLEAMLPSGVTLEQAADGFRNKGQFIAALQQSHNHQVSFVDLKAQMTGDNPLSLGQAMRTLAAKAEED